MLTFILAMSIAHRVGIGPHVARDCRVFSSELVYETWHLILPGSRRLLEGSIYSWTIPRGTPLLVIGQSGTTEPPWYRVVLPDGRGAIVGRSDVSY